MEIRCAREDLLKGMQLVETGVSTKSTLPILSNVLIQTEQKRIVFISTDLEIGIKCGIPGKIVQSGEITIPAKKFTDIIKELPPEEVEIKVPKTAGEKTEGENQVTISCGETTFWIMGIPPKDEFPPFPKFDASRAVTMPSNLLKKMINLTLFAVSYDETRYVLNGVYFVTKDREAKMIATDGRRLSYIKQSDALQSELTSTAIIPTKTMNELIRILSGGEAETQIIVEENQVVFKNGDIILVSRLIEGNFPNYEQVIPTKSRVKIEIDREHLMQSTRRAALLTDERNNSVKYLFSKKRLIVSASTPDLGSAQDEFGVDYTGEELTIAYNPHYVIDVLKNLDSKEIYLELSDPLSPGVIRPAELPEGEDYLYVVMPMRL